MQERLSLSMKDLSTPIKLQVFDEDPTTSELMGTAKIPVDKLEPNQDTEVIAHIALLAGFWVCQFMVRCHLGGCSAGYPGFHSGDTPVCSYVIVVSSLALDIFLFPGAHVFVMICRF